MAKQPNWKRQQAAEIDRQNVRIKPEKKNGKQHAKKLQREGLEAMKMDALRKIGAKLGVKDNKKDELIDKILEAQG